MRRPALKDAAELAGGAQLLTEEQFVELARRAYRVSMYVGQRYGFGAAGDFADALLGDVRGVLWVAFAGRGLRSFAGLARGYRRYLKNSEYSQEVGL